MGDNSIHQFYFGLKPFFGDPFYKNDFVQYFGFFQPCDIKLKLPEWNFVDIFSIKSPLYTNNCFMPYLNFNFNNPLTDTFTPPTSVLDTQTTSGNSTETSVQPTSPNPEASRTKSNKVPHWSKQTDEEMKQTYGNYDYDITKLYNGTAADLNKYLKGKGKLDGKGEAFLNAQNKYGISAAVLIAICCHESGNGKKLCAANNVGGVRDFYAKGKWRWKQFGSIEDCVMDIARFLKNNYVDNPAGKGKSIVKSLTKLYQINAKYCPGAETSSNTTWASRVQRNVKQIEQTRA